MKIETMTNAARTLEARGLCKQYGKQTVLDHVDLLHDVLDTDGGRM